MALTKQQLSERKNFIGSSEAKIIADGSFADWAKLISEKKGEQERLVTKQLQFMFDTGNYMEAFVLDNFALITDLKVGARGTGKTIDYQGVPIHSTYDAIASDGNPIEAKTHFGFMSMDELCDLYAPQCQHHMHTRAKEYCYIVVFFGVHCRIEYRKLQRDDAWLEMYLDQCKQFWHWYSKDIMPDAFTMLPPVDWTDQITMNMSDLECWDNKMQSEMNLNAQDIIEASKANKIADTAKTEIKHYLPANCRKMVLDLSGNLKGDKIIVSRSKTNTITLKHQPKKENKDGN
jgi:hypothetical protein